MKSKWLRRFIHRLHRTVITTKYLCRKVEPTYLRRKILSNASPTELQNLVSFCCALEIWNQFLCSITLLSSYTIEKSQYSDSSALYKLSILMRCSFYFEIWFVKVLSPSLLSYSFFPSICINVLHLCCNFLCYKPHFASFILLLSLKIYSYQAIFLRTRYVLLLTAWKI